MGLDVASGRPETTAAGHPATNEQQEGLRGLKRRKNTGARVLAPRGPRRCPPVHGCVLQAPPVSVLGTGCERFSVSRALVCPHSRTVPSVSSLFPPRHCWLFQSMCSNCNIVPSAGPSVSGVSVVSTFFQPTLFLFPRLLFPLPPSRLRLPPLAKTPLTHSHSLTQSW